MNKQELEQLNRLEDLDIVAELHLKVRRNGAMSVEGCIKEEAYALAMLDNARDSIRRFNGQRKLGQGNALITPSYDCPRIEL